MSRLADELCVQYGRQQAAALRGDHVARTIASDWLHRIADSHWHEIIAALRASEQPSRDATGFNPDLEDLHQAINYAERVRRELTCLTEEQDAHLCDLSDVAWAFYKRLRAAPEQPSRDADQDSERLKLARAEKLLREFITTCELYKYTSDKHFDLWTDAEAARVYFKETA